MAHKRRRDTDKVVHRNRDATIISNRPRLLPVMHLLPSTSRLLEIEDFRRSSFPIRRARAYRTVTAAAINPMPDYVPASLPKLPTQRQRRPASRSALTREAIVCVRRQQRREVLFATGYGGSSRKRSAYRRSETSNIVCKRK